MNNLADNKFDFDDDDAFTEEELAELEALSDEDIDFDDEDFDIDDIEFDDLEDDDLDVEAVDSWDEGVVENDSAVSLEAAGGTQSAPDVIEAPEFSTDDLNTAAQALSNDIVEEEADFVAPDARATTEFSEASLPPQVEMDAPIAEEMPELPSVAAAVAAAGVVEEAYEYQEEAQEGDHIPVPRVNIHVFCETAEISNLVEAAAADRRLAKAHVTLLMGGIGKAVDHYQSESTPNLIILETVSAGSELFNGLEQLAEVCDPSTRVIVIGAINDIRLYRELVDRGISEYLISPTAPIQITRSIASLYADPSAPPIGRNIVFVGARGGVGSSTVCHNVAWAMAEEYKSDAVILDLDLAFGTASLDFEQDPSQGLAEALAAPERLDDVLLDRLLQKCTDRLSLFAAPNMLDRNYDMPASSFEEVIDLVRKGAPNIIIDLPHVWTEWSRNILQTADEIVITATPDLSSFRNVKNLLESIKAARVNDSAPYLILNQMDVPKRPEIPADQFTEALGIEPAAIINWDPQLFGTASTNAEPVFEVNEKAKASQAMYHVARLLLGQGDLGQKKSAFDIKSLFKKL